MEEFILTLKNLWLNYHVWLCVVLSFILRSIYVCPFNIGFSSPIWILDNTRAIYNKMSSHKIPTNSWSYLLQPLTILKAVWDNLNLNFITRLPQSQGKITILLPLFSSNICFISTINYYHSPSSCFHHHLSPWWHFPKDHLRL